MDKVVVIDERPIYVQLLERRLRGVGYRGSLVRFSVLTPFWSSDFAGGSSLVVAGLRYPDGNGFDLCRRLLRRSQHSALLFWTEHTNAPAYLEAYESGALGMVSKRLKVAELATVIMTALAGAPVWTDEQWNAMERWRHEVLAPLSMLTDRERAIATELALRRTNHEIAETLVLSIRTVEGHVSHILAKLDFENRFDLARWAEKVEWDRWIRFRRTLLPFPP